MRLLLSGVVAGLLALAFAPASDGAQRFASPAGTGTTCEPASPCALSEAIENAQTDDEVVVTAGSYSLPTNATVPFGAEDVHVHGDFGGPMPRITGSFTGSLIQLGGTGGRLSYLDLVNDYGSAVAVGASCPNGGRIERVRATAIGPGGIGIYQFEDCVVRDSLARAVGSKAVGLASYGQNGLPGVARNVTAIATGDESVGVQGGTTILAGAQSHKVELQNTIASGEGADLTAFANAVYQVATTISVSTSNYDDVETDPGASIVDGGGNQTAAPLFLNAAAGDFREAAGSPTIDAGSAGDLGALDPDGIARILGPAPDIGAFELVPAVPSPAPPGTLRSLSVKPGTFRAVNVGEAIFSRAGKRAPVGGTVEYGLSGAASPTFTVERVVKGRRAGSRCVKQTAANATKKRCPYFKPVKGGFTHPGAAGSNEFMFSGRISGRALKPGPYRLLGSAGGTSKTARFKIAR